VTIPAGLPFNLGSDRFKLHFPEEADALDGDEVDPDESADPDEASDESVVEVEEVHGSPGEPVLLVGPGGIEDPETTWDYGDGGGVLPEHDPDQYFWLTPGEDVVVVDQLPRPRRGSTAFIMGAGELALSDGKRRYWVRTPAGTSRDHPEAPVASKLVVIFVAHRAVRRSNRPRRYIAFLDVSDDLIGWMDYSDTWPLRTDRVQQMAELCGVRVETERYRTESEFEAARPSWVG
jgi:hypothetical protein